MDDHEHCFCRLNMDGKPMCCKCGIILEAAIIDYELFIQQEQIKHLKETNQIRLHGKDSIIKKQDEVS